MLSRESIGIIIVAVVGSSALLYLTLSVPTYRDVIVSNDIIVCTYHRAVSIENSAGFINVKSGTIAGKYEFVLSPGSSGKITIVYDFCPDIRDYIMNRPSPTTLKDLTKILNSTTTVYAGLLRLMDDKGEEVVHESGYINRVWTYVSDISKESLDSVRVTYTINAVTSAERGIYLVKPSYSCVGILTVGDKPIADSLAWKLARLWCTFSRGSWDSAQ